MVYPLRGSYIKTCWANGVIIISFRWRVVAPRDNSFDHPCGSQATEDRGWVSLPTASTWGNLICCWLQGFEYTRGLGPYRECCSPHLCLQWLDFLESWGQMGDILHENLKWCGELDQNELHDLKVPPCHYCPDGISDQDYLLTNTMFECEHADLWVVSATRHSLALETLSRQWWIQFFSPALLGAFRNPQE